MVLCHDIRRDEYRILFFHSKRVLSSNFTSFSMSHDSERSHLEILILIFPTTIHTPIYTHLQEKITCAIYTHMCTRNVINIEQIAKRTVICSRLDFLTFVIVQSSCQMVKSHNVHYVR